jgi:hypothetical protein
LLSGSCWSSAGRRQQAIIVRKSLVIIRPLSAGRCQQAVVSRLCQQAVVSRPLSVGCRQQVIASSGSCQAVIHNIQIMIWFFSLKNVLNQLLSLEKPSSPCF